MIVLTKLLACDIDVESKLEIEVQKSTPSRTSMISQ
jgi:hypothetical protein